MLTLSPSRCEEPPSTPSFPVPNLRPLPLKRTPQGLLIGSVLSGEPEERLIQEILLSGGAAQIHGYNGTLHVASLNPHTNAFEIRSDARRLLTTQCNPDWSWHTRGPYAAEQFIHLMDSAPTGELEKTCVIYGEKRGFVIDGTLYPVPTAIRGRLRLLQDPRRDLWLGNLDFTMSPTCRHLLIDTPQGQHIASRDDVLLAARQILHD